MLTNTMKTPAPFAELGYWMDTRNTSTAPSNWMSLNLGDSSKVTVEFIEGNSNHNFNTTCKVTAINTVPDIGPVGSQTFDINRLDLEVINRLKPRFTWPGTPGIVYNRKTAFNILMQMYGLPLYDTVNDQIPWLLNPDDDVTDQAFIDIEVDSKTCPYYFGKLRVCTLYQEELAYIFQNNVIKNTEPLQYFNIMFDANKLNPLTIYDANRTPFPEQFYWEIEEVDGPEGTNTRAKIWPTEETDGFWMGECYIYYNRFDLAEYTAALPHTVPWSTSGSDTNYERSSRWLAGNQFQIQWKEWDVVDPNYQNPLGLGEWVFTTGPQCRTWFPGTDITLTVTDPSPPLPPVDVS